jgi:hypothetical protein
MTHACPPSCRTLARYRAYLAKAHVLWDLGRLEAGDAVFRNIA